MPYSSAPIWFLLEDMVLKFHHFLQGIEWKSQIFKIFFNWVFRNFIKSQHKVWHFLLAFWGFKWHHFLPKITEVAILSLMKFLKIPLWYEIYSFDNSVKVCIDPFLVILSKMSPLRSLAGSPLLISCNREILP